MEKVADILEEVRSRVAAALSIPLGRVYLCPAASELPQDDDPFVAIAAEIDSGRPGSGAYDDAILRVDVAAYLTDFPVGEDRLRRRIGRASAVHAALTPTPANPGVPKISGWDRPVLVSSIVEPAQDVVGQLFVGMTFESEISLPRGGYGG